jgi:hypothetical protein
MVLSLSEVQALPEKRLQVFFLGGGGTIAEYEILGSHGGDIKL